VTDRRLLDAAMALVAEQGWDAASVLAVAKRAGMTSRAVDDRFDSRSDLAIGVWRDGPVDALGDALIALVDAMLPAAASSQGGLARGLRAGGSNRQAHGLPELLRMARPSEHLVVAAELLCAGVFDPVLRAAIAGDLHERLAARCLPGEGTSPSQAAQGAYLVATGLGLLLAYRRPGAEELDISPLAAALAAALADPAKPQQLPDVDAGQMRLDPVGPVHDDHDALLEGTILEVAENGYSAATLARIVARVGVTQGLVYSRYRNKIELFMAAIRWRTEYALRANLDWFAQLTSEFGAGIAEAVSWREFMRPEHELGRALALEQVRVGWREPEFRAEHDAAERAFTEHVLQANPQASPDALRAQVHWDLAMGYGAELLPSFMPHAWSLPFDVVTVPLFGTRDKPGLIAPLVS
jgi:AcrR family transcriptional regulator